MNRPTLSDASPHVLFRGRYVFRTPNGVGAFILPVLFGGAFVAIVIATSTYDGRDPIVAFGNVWFALGGLLFFGLGLRALWGLIRNERIVVEINEAGIIRDKRFYPWDQVRSFEGTRYSNGVSLGFTTSGKMAGFAPGELPTTPLLTEEEYMELAREVSRYISSQFPHVQIAMEPLEPPSS